MTGVEVLQVVVRVDRTEKERRQGVATDARRQVRAYCQEEFGWGDATVSVERADADTVTIKAWLA